MRTTIVIEHTTVESLKASPLWSMIMALMLAEAGDVSVVEISAAEDEPTEPQEPNNA